VVVLAVKKNQITVSPLCRGLIADLRELKYKPDRNNQKLPSITATPRVDTRSHALQQGLGAQGIPARSLMQRSCWEVACQHAKNAKAVPVAPALLSFVLDLHPEGFSLAVVSTATASNKIDEESREDGEDDGQPDLLHPHLVLPLPRDPGWNGFL
jgi:hypothetical protein